MSSVLRVFEPSGILDANSSEVLRQEIKTALSDGADLILVNLSQVSFLDSSGLGGLVRSLKLTRSEGARLFLCSLSEQANLLFDITCMNRTFDIFPNQSVFESEVLHGNARVSSNI